MPPPTCRTTRSRSPRSFHTTNVSRTAAPASPRARSRSSNRADGDWDTRCATWCSAGEEQRQQVVEEAPAALGRPDALPVALEQTALFRLFELRRGKRQARALHEERDRK